MSSNSIKRDNRVRVGRQQVISYVLIHNGVTTTLNCIFCSSRDFFGEGLGFREDCFGHD